jgi:2-dehydro-3-deoxyphosphogluconate aldolase/(4S)-4-hydroxy-2-oxoglutarate aldolase
VEITLRSENALTVLKHVVEAFPNTSVGAATVKSAEDFKRIIEAGAKFAVSPGATTYLLAEASRWDLPYWPAAATVSEVMHLQGAGFNTVKMFTAGSLGGPGFMSSVAGPLPDIAFIPSGGVGKSNFLDYLALANVPALSGSWMLNKSLIKAFDWKALADEIKETVKQLNDAALND